RIDARLIAVQDGRDVASASAVGSSDRIFDLEQQLVDKLTSSIDAKLRDPSARRKSKAPDLEALLAYSRAIDLSDQGKLVEAQAAMQALVSKAPSFLMARERKQEMVAKLVEYEKRKRDMATASVLELGRLAERRLLRDADRFDSLDDAGQHQGVAMRMVRGRDLMRVIKQF